MKENQFAKRITNDIRKANGLVLSIVGNKMQAPGWPDIFVAHNYWSGFIEFKGQNTPVKPHQYHIMKQLVNRKVPVIIVRYPNLIRTPEGRLIGKFDDKQKNIGVEILKFMKEHVAE